MVAHDEYCHPLRVGDAWNNEQRKIHHENELELRKIEALERIAEALESMRSAQWLG